MNLGRSNLDFKHSLVFIRTLNPLTSCVCLCSSDPGDWHTSANGIDVKVKCGAPSMPSSIYSDHYLFLEPATHLTQHTGIRAARNLSDFSNKVHFFTWVHTRIANKRSITHDRFLHFSLHKVRVAFVWFC